VGHVITVKRTGLGTTAVEIEQDCVLVGVISNTSYLVSYDPSETVALLTAGSPAGISRNAIHFSTTSVGSVLPGIEFYSGETIYVSTGAAGTVQLRLLDKAELNLSSLFS
jgi:hypothetical protein